MHITLAFPVVFVLDETIVYRELVQLTAYQRAQQWAAQGLWARMRQGEALRACRL